MHKLELKQLFVNGFLIWLIPFLVAMFIYPIRGNNRALFESIMPVVLTLTTMFASIRYFKNIKNPSAINGLVVGIIWMTVSIVIDLIMFVFGPIKMSLMEYIQDIGITYIIIPIVVYGYFDVTKPPAPVKELNKNN